MELFDFIVEQISELTDVNSEEITRETPLAELDLEIGRASCRERV